MRALLTALIGVFWLAMPAWALDAPDADARILLTVEGPLAVSNSEQGARFDRALLRSVGWNDVTTHSPYLEGEHRFGGVPIADLFSTLGINDGRLRATALDGYSVTLSVAELIERDALLAMEHNDREMRVRNRGPIWLIFPMDAQQVRTLPDDGKMIWQLHTLTLLP